MLLMPQQLVPCLMKFLNLACVIIYLLDLWVESSCTEINIITNDPVCLVYVSNPLDGSVPSTLW